MPLWVMLGEGYCLQAGLEIVTKRVANEAGTQPDEWRPFISFAQVVQRVRVDAKQLGHDFSGNVFGSVVHILSPVIITTHAGKF